MKYVKFLIALITTTALVFALNKKWGAVPPMGKFLSPQQGFWKNGDKAADFKNGDVQFGNLKGKANVYFDKRLVPHIFAENDEDAYFIQGFIHAKHRLWQMEFQTYFAAGRLCEIVGEKALPLDRKFRRLGMVFAAENSVMETEKDAMSKMATDQYTAGVNAYITQLKQSDYPLEYKILDYQPEPWTNLKTALLLKYMSFDLSGYEDDFEKQNTKAIFNKLLYETIYQYGNDSLSPIVPMGTTFSEPGINLKIPKNVDSVYLNYQNQTATDIKDDTKPNKNNGSNNWAVSGSKTKTGKPILCNDPHLGLNLPSLWYEMQLHTPTQNSYGATLPGTPAVIIGFNDSCSFGFTNAMRDVRDYYEIKFKDNSKKEYWFNNAWQPSTIKIETIKVKGQADYIDTVAYIKEFGPVMYDASFRGAGLGDSKEQRTDGKNYAVTWIAHKPSNEMRTFLLLNRSRNFKDYENAISTFVCPGQNMIFACNNGDIAIKQQGVFPAKWYRQGDFPMPGFDSSYMWQGMIPQNENYMVKNPERGFVSSANQYPYDTKTYPYYLGGNYPFTRGLYVNQQLSGMQNITPIEMQNLQNDNYNIFGKMLLPILVKYTDENKLEAGAKKYFSIVKNWNSKGDAKETGQTIFYEWNNRLEEKIWKDELSKVKNYVWPQESTLLDALKRDSAMGFIDDINTPEKESLRQLVTASLNEISSILEVQEKEGKLEWSKYKATFIKHLMDTNKDLALSRFNLPIGGGVHMLNATTDNHGPSWKMIVQMTDKVEAYGVYPGGQSGNAGSAYYDNFIDTWASGKYYKLWFMQQSEAKSEEVLFTLNFSK
jgi:penicillin G amidase